MHSILQNDVPLLWKIWTGGIKGIEASLQPVEIDEIGNAMKNSRANMPASLGHAPRHIGRHHNGFKASEWKAWLLHFAVPLLDQRLPRHWVKNIRDLKRIFYISTKQQISMQDIDEVEELCNTFITEYEACYFQDIESHLPVCRINIHSLKVCVSTITSILCLLDNG